MRVRGLGSRVGIEYKLSRGVFRGSISDVRSSSTSLQVETFFDLEEFSEQAMAWVTSLLLDQPFANTVRTVNSATLGREMSAHGLS